MSRTIPLRLLSSPSTATRCGHRSDAGLRARRGRGASAVTACSPAGCSVWSPRPQPPAAERQHDRSKRERPARSVGRPRLVVAGRGRPHPAAAERAVGAERGHRPGQILLRRLVERARCGGSALSGSSSIVPLSHAFQPGGTLLPSLSPA